MPQIRIRRLHDILEVVELHTVGMATSLKATADLSKHQESALLVLFVATDDPAAILAWCAMIESAGMLDT